MRRLDWWIGVLLVAGALLIHALVPRYEFRHMEGHVAQDFYRIDRWTGRMEAGYVAKEGSHFGRWVSSRQLLWESQQGRR
jgi:hypothetical protein